jgi:hypothetical protein
MYENFVKPTIKYCEDNLHSYIAQPANAWSNLVFVFVGVYIYLKSRDHKNPLLKFLGPMAVLIGIFSFIYHASYTFIGQFLDLGSMYLFSSYLIILNLRRLNKEFFTTRKLLFIFSLLIFTSFSATYFIRTINNFNIGLPIFALQILVVLILEWQLHKRKVSNYKIHSILIAFVIFMFAFILWILDFLRIWCEPSTFHLINGHALWHILSAISFLFVYFFYRQFD